MTAFFVDTSVWIDYFRDPASVYKKILMDLIEEDRIYTNGIVVAELLIGAKSALEFDVASDLRTGVRFLESDAAFFLQTGRNGYHLRRKGLTVPLSDVMIATHCLEHDLTLISQDRHFEILAEHLPLKRYPRA